MPVEKKRDQYSLMTPKNGQGPADHMRVLNALEFACRDSSNHKRLFLRFFIEEFYHIYNDPKTTARQKWDMLRYIDEVRAAALAEHIAKVKEKAKKKAGKDKTAPVPDEDTPDVLSNVRLVKS